MGYIALFLCAGAIAQPPPAAMALARGHAARAAGDFPLAERCYRAAITEAATLPADDPGAAEPYLALLELYADWKKPDEMEAALGELTARLGGGPPGAARAGAHVFARAARVQHAWRSARAQVLYQHALRLYEAGYGGADVRLLPVLGALAELYGANGHQREQAEPLWQRAIGIVERDGGADDARLADLLLRLARLHLDWPERVGLVEDELGRALELREQAYGRDDPRVAEALLAQAEYYRRPTVQRYREAEACAGRALAILEGAYGVGDVRLMPAVQVLAQVYEHDFGDAPAAERARLRIVAMYDAAYGERDWRAGDARMAVAALCLKQERFADAEAHLRKALATRQQVDEPAGWSNVMLLSWLGRACHRQRKIEEAAGLYRRAAAVTDRLFAEGHFHPAIIPAVYEEAIACLREGGAPAEAEAIADRAAACARRVWPDGVARLLFNAEWQRTHPDPDGGWIISAESYYRLALLIQSRKKLPDDPALAEIRRTYAAFLRDIGRGAEADAIK
ncbi:MAG TPA: tetratricopeptide repeat protein [Armatimonadota bacterium]|nr:tetratricopeptide repeat protein [Armatimonadota bacterium]